MQTLHVCIECSTRKGGYMQLYVGTEYVGNTGNHFKGPGAIFSEAST